MKKQLNTVVVTKDGWVYVITKDKQFGLGDIDVDCSIVDLRVGRNGKKKSMAQELLKSGLSQSEIARELGVSRQAVSLWLKPKK